MWTCLVLLEAAKLSSKVVCRILHFHQQGMSFCFSWSLPALDVDIVPDFDHLIMCGLLKWLSGKESSWQYRRHKRWGFNAWVGKIYWRRKSQPTLVFLPGKFHAQRSLQGYSPWGHEESDTTEWLKTRIQKRCIVLSCFNMRFPNKIWCWAFTHRLICHLFIFHGGVSAKDFGQYIGDVVGFLLLRFKSYLYILHQFFIIHIFCKYFSLSLWLVLSFFWHCI